MSKDSVKLRVSLTATLVFVWAQAIGQEAVSPELEAVRATVSERFSEIDPENIVASPIEGWYTVSKGAIVAYISADGRYLLQGDLLDLTTNINMSEQARNTARARMMSGVDAAEVITFSPAEVEHTVSVFTDIDCTFCRRLHAQIDDYMAEGIEIRYFLYPRNGPTSPSWAPMTATKR